MTSDHGSQDATAGPPDAELAVLAGAGDQVALGAIFDRYAPRLLAFCVSMLRSRADAEDCLQDVFIIAATRLSGLREPDRLRSWLFTVARHVCLTKLEKGKREVPVDAIPDAPSAEADQPATHALDAELAELLAGAIAGLPERDRLALELADRQGLPTDEVATVLGMSPPSAYKLLTRARAGARRSLGALVVARTGRADCAQLDLLLGGWTGTLTPLLRKRIARHIEECEVCGARERRLVTPAALLGSGPAFALPITLRSKVLDAAARARSADTGAAISSGAAGLTSSGAAELQWRGGWPKGSAMVRRSGPSVYLTAAIIVAALIVAGLVIRGEHDRTVAGRGVTPPLAGSPQRLPTTATPSTAAVSPTATAGSSASTTAATPAPAATGPGGTTRPTRTGSSTSIYRSPSAATAPQIDAMSVQCVYSQSAASYTPVLTWRTSRDTGIALSVDNPGVVGSYGQYGPSGTTELPPNGCEPAAGEQIYTITTVGGVGPAATRTIHWQPPTDLATPTPTVTTSSPPPIQ